MVASKKGKKGAFLKGHAGYGQRNAAGNAADEPDAGVRANECPPVALADTHYHYVNTSIPRFVKHSRETACVMARQQY